MKKRKCRFCNAELRHSFADLGMSPLSNSYLKEEQLHTMEPFFPLHAYVCDACYLVQLEEFQTPSDIFSDYAYFSSYSDAWLAHARNYAEHIVSDFDIGGSSLVVELASNDGYLLKYFAERDIPVLGIEPAANVAEVAVAKGVPTLVKFFGEETAKALAGEGRRADLVIGNNVLAHVPDINDFVLGMKTLLKEDGMITMEFPHLLKLMDENQFDTIYHEHFSYLSLTTVEEIFSSHGLMIFDVRELPTHGGSLRIYACHQEREKQVSAKVMSLREKEMKAGLREIGAYTRFAGQVRETKRKLLSFLIGEKNKGKVIVGYGAPAKGNTLLNYCGIRTDFLEYTVDASPHKQGLYLPGTHIPVHAPQKIFETRPDYVLILPWNIKDEIMKQMEEIRTWGGRFITPIPEVQVH